MRDRPRFLAMVTGVLAGLVICGTGNAQTEQDVRQHIAKAYGIQSWAQVEQLRFTFRVQRGKEQRSRSWMWEPKTDRVSFQGADKQGKPVKLTYLRSELNAQPTQELKEIDASFINDQYWLLFPFHLVWDRAAKVEDTGMHELPRGPGNGRRVVVTYPPNGGYTPGDVYELFVGEDGRIIQWAYHQGGAPKPTLAASWEENRHLGPLVVSLNHPSAKGDVRVWFTEVAVKLAGSERWIAAN
ncbi:MAG TPA: hypothetical protein VKE24_14790 [Candidatus Acidoferrales bacterium]|nr:hypothetical protein [Candidatus Acidoferrales bacterium]